MCISSRSESVANLHPIVSPLDDGHGVCLGVLGVPILTDDTDDHAGDPFSVELTVVGGGVGVQLVAAFNKPVVVNGSRGRRPVVVAGWAVAAARLGVPGRPG